VAIYRPAGTWDRVLTVCLVILGCAALIAGAVLLTPRYPVAWFLLLALGVLFGLVGWHARRFGYRCEHCGEHFHISVLADLVSPNGLSVKYVRCPKCGAREWREPLVRQT
jgi:DNA-directed RNA polymerase subunit RPC12/RpoP